ISSIAVIGPNADDASYSGTHYGPQGVNAITVLQGIEDKVGVNVTVNYAKGSEIYDATWPESQVLPQPLTEEEQAEIDAAVAAAQKSDVAILVLGGSIKTAGENKSSTSLALPGHQLDLAKA